MATRAPASRQMRAAARSSGPALCARTPTWAQADPIQAIMQSRIYEFKAIHKFVMPCNSSIHHAMQVYAAYDRMHMYTGLEQTLSDCLRRNDKKFSHSLSKSMITLAPECSASSSDERHT